MVIVILYIEDVATREMVITIYNFRKDFQDLRMRKVYMIRLICDMKNKK